MQNRSEFDIMDPIGCLSDGNIGALSLMTQLSQTPDFFMLCLTLDDMNMRGPQIWVAFDMHCGRDQAKFIAAVQARDPEMVKTVNLYIGRGGHKAVTGGGSDKREMIAA
jgi:hypothetical protein